PAAPSAAKFLPDQGPPTLKIDPPGPGDAARHEPPFLGGVPHPDRSSLFLAFNTNKRGITLDVATPTGRDLLLRVLADRDVLIESFAPGYLDSLALGYAALREVNPSLLVVCVTSFGHTV